MTAMPAWMTAPLPLFKITLERPLDPAKAVPEIVLVASPLTVMMPLPVIMASKSNSSSRPSKRAARLVNGRG